MDLRICSLFLSIHINLVTPFPSILLDNQLNISSLNTHFYINSEKYLIEDIFSIFEVFI